MAEGDAEGAQALFAQALERDPSCLDGFARQRAEKVCRCACLCLCLCACACACACVCVSVCVCLCLCLCWRVYCTVLQYACV